MIEKNRRAGRAQDRDVARGAQRVPPALHLPEARGHSVRRRADTHQEQGAPLAHHRPADGQCHLYCHTQAHSQIPVFVCKFCLSWL